MKKLGRGLDSLISSGKSKDAEHEGAMAVPCLDIVPNPYQPRKAFDEAALVELADSITKHGVIQPIVVRLAADGYELVAGERRWRAARRAGLEHIPVVVREVADDQMLEIALIENIQREDLNPIEKAQAYLRFVEKLGLTHEEAGKRLGKTRPAVTNQIRLLDLPVDLQEMVSRETLSMGHARALLGLAEEQAQRQVAQRIESEGLSVRDVEKIVRAYRKNGGAAPTEPKAPAPVARSAHLEELERRLRERFATRARIDGSKERGRIVLEYFTMDELGRLLDLLLNEEDGTL